MAYQNPEGVEGAAWSFERRETLEVGHEVAPEVVAAAAAEIDDHRTDPSGTTDRAGAEEENVHRVREYGGNVHDDGKD